MKATVIGLSDTWLDDDVHHYEINISGCSLECKDRKREGGGICTYVRNDLVFNRRTGLVYRIKKSTFRFVRKLPYVRTKIKEEMAKTYNELENTFHSATKGQSFVQKLPDKGLNEVDVLKELQKYKSLGEIFEGMMDVDWKKGACSGTVYSGEDDLSNLMAKVYGEFAWTNPLHADVFPDIRKMEAEVVRMTCHMFNGGPNSCGTMTSGGTESIMLACKAYRDMAMERGINFPEIIVPVTAHAAFDKAADCFRMAIKHIAIDPVTRKVNIKAMRHAITRNTCMLVGSAPQFPHGVVDHIQEIGKLGIRYNIPVHVDSCLGGFLVPFMKKAGFDVEPFDFTVPGVTSISADTHKYGFAPKGSSVILYSDKKYRKYQYFVQPDWPGGIYASPTFAGSRAGAIIAACWATMMYMGEEGYVEATRKIVKTIRYIEQELRKMPDIFVYGKAEVSVVGIGSKKFNIYRLSDALSAKGWNLNPLQFPSSIHLCVTLVHTKEGVADRFITDIRDCVTEIMKDQSAECKGQGAMYGMAQSIPDRSLVSEIAGSFFDAYYNTAEKEVVNGVL
ncbi:hypothetical protein LSH36_142g07003 [Paralvinella palmiformis]|uniref:Sphingosine-1-phosphate lyase 1 n=1 Tax=Paralvinella palmiformis TaxID=53620 RepID=A0AAD9JVY8_9ANNE|nr:hypothetical protein LSH36_142g07003 [Paralvinella palmiformis]